jgi:hypothetical protein
MQVSKVYTVEYSVVQHCYHIDTLDKTLRTNLEHVETGLNNGYLIIGLFKDYDSASDFVAYHRNHIRLGSYRINQNGEIEY